MLCCSIRGHPTSEVSRKAKALVFGFQAASFLKADTISYAVKKDEYLKYFRWGRACHLLSKYVVIVCYFQKT